METIMPCSPTLISSEERGFGGKDFTSTLLFLGVAESFLVLQDSFGKNHRILQQAGELPTSHEVEKYVTALIPEIERLGGKRTSIIAQSAGCSVAKEIVRQDPRLIRRVVLINPQARVAPTLITRIIDRIETFLPVGLPLRAATKQFDSRSFLHRLRCPFLVVRSAHHNLFLDAEAAYIAAKLPNSYTARLTHPLLNEGRFSAESALLFEQFMLTAPKRPQ